MQLDLTRLREMHPDLPSARAADLVHCAALGLQRNGHMSGVPMPVRLDASTQDTTVAWEIADERAHAHLDRHRITEDAAEAISLALVREALNWVIERRGQRGDHADWFLRDPQDNAVAFEVSGIDAGDHLARLRSKVSQVGRSLADRREACVVELATPRAALATQTAPAP